MRVVHVITRLIIGGAQENTVITVLGLLKKPGVEVKLITGPTKGPEGSLEEKVLGYPGLLITVPELVRPIHPLKDLVCFLKLVRLFRNLRPDIVHTHSGKAGFLGRMAAYFARVPVIVHTIHGPSFGQFQGFLPNVIYLTAERIAGRVTTFFVSVADAMSRHYLAHGIGTPEKYLTVRSGFAIKPYLEAKNDPQFRAKLGLSETDFVVGKIARLFKLKGHDDLITVATQIVQVNPQVRFLLVGDGYLKERLQSRIRDLGLERHFVFAGLVPPDEIPRYVGIMDCIVHLSKREGLPKALAQALAAGKPVIAYDCDGAGEVCIPNKTGFLIQPGDLEGVSNAILTLANDAALRLRLGSEGRKLIVEWFDSDRMVDTLYELYLRLMSQKA
jgi:glycosyltransferase involved in cell wall biosynthesis